jgi:cytochrome c oxidase assembly protein subunit 11
MATVTHQAGNARRTALIAAVAALFMLGLGFAAVPLYRIFCETTGFGGTTQRASESQLAALADRDASSLPVTRMMSVRFDSNIGNGLPWQFEPEKTHIPVSVGGKSMAIFVAKNLSDKPVTGSAVFNVSPGRAGRYFTKIQCFCFTEQTLQPGQQVRMPVLFFVDKAILDDPDTRNIEEITLSYTFYPVEKPGNQS